MNLVFSPMSIFDPWGFVEEGWSKIQLGLYQPCEENEYKSICYGDSVWIFHLESGSFVKVLDNQEVTDSVIVKKISTYPITRRVQFGVHQRRKGLLESRTPQNPHPKSRKRNVCREVRPLEDHFRLQKR